MKSFAPEDLDRRTLGGMLNSLIAPRPVAWVSTLSIDGRRNLAPFSFFNLFSYDPPIIAFGPGWRRGTAKDTLRNVKDTGEFVISLVSEDLVEAANESSRIVPPEIDEWEMLGVAGTPSDSVAPERVAASPAAFECRVLDVVDLGTWDGVEANNLVIGRVQRLHVIDAALPAAGGPPDPDALRLVARMGGDLWCRTRDTFVLPPPPRP